MSVPVCCDASFFSLPLPVTRLPPTSRRAARAILINHTVFAPNKNPNRAPLVWRCCSCSDLKLENVLVARNGHLKLGDFGLARKVQESEGDERIGPRKERNSVVGTVHSMAPEVFTDKNYGRRVHAPRNHQSAETLYEGAVWTQLAHAHTAHAAVTNLPLPAPPVRRAFWCRTPGRSSVDWWSLGVMLGEMLFGCSPLPNVDVSAVHSCHREAPL